MSAGEVNIRVVVVTVAFCFAAIKVGRLGKQFKVGGRGWGVGLLPTRFAGLGGSPRGRHSACRLSMKSYSETAIDGRSYIGYKFRFLLISRDRIFQGMSELMFKVKH